MCGTCNCLSRESRRQGSSRAVCFLCLAETVPRNLNVTKATAAFLLDIARSVFTSLPTGACALAAPTGGAPWSASGHGRIINGTDASIADFPWMASLQLAGDHWCGASVIGDSWALTAAHCVFRHEVANMSVRAGTSTRGSGGVVLSVSQAIIHDDFSIISAEYDIAVVQVAEPFPLGPTVQPVVLPGEGYDPPVGLPVTATGWGATQDGGAAEELQSADLEVLDRSECEARLGQVHHVTASMLCAGHPSRAVCHGDSGSALVHAGTQLGVVSWGNSSCLGPVAVYGNVASARAWIRDTTGV
ncbi:trypsin delta-like [Schistocerca americana]|uniref:trypsin delta-like n=1 Tax=Schistocerca americana TaxID=7009 RepID=UPI001F4F3F64|nr:trypsin delta-like [Schistocerca americana]